MAKQKELSVKELVSIDFTIIDGSKYEVEIYEPSQEVYRREKDKEGKYQDVELLGYKVTFQLHPKTVGPKTNINGKIINTKVTYLGSNLFMVVAVLLKFFCD